MKKQYSNKSTKKTTSSSPVNKKQARKALITALEPRLLLDGAAVATAVDVLTDSQLHDAFQMDVNQQDSDTSFVIAPTEVRAVDPSQNNGKKEVIFIEDNVSDYQTLIDAANTGIEIVILDSTQDGLAQMALWAETHTDFDAIHLISHGAEGSLNLGGLHLDSTAISGRSADLAKLGSALNKEGDLLLYGCEVASGEGQDFIVALAKATQADVAASDDLTGSAELGGDWELEVKEGAIESSSLSIYEFNKILPTITFDTVTQNGNYAVNVSEQGVEVSVTTENANNIFAQANASVGGASGNLIGDTQGDGLTKVIFTFDTTVDITSIQYIETSNFSSGTYVFTNTTSGSSESVAINASDSTDINGIHGQLATLNLTNVDTMEVTYSGGVFAPAFDNLIFTPSVSNTTPTLSGTPTDITVTEDTASNVDLSAVTFADSDGDSLTATLTASAGTLAASSGGSVTVSGSGTGTLTLSGTAANINTYLDTASNVQYTGASNASGGDAATLSIKANDGTTDSSVATVNIDITAVNDIPVINNLSDGTPSTTLNISEYIDVQGDIAGVVDVDGGDFNGGYLLIEQTSGTANGSFLSDLDDITFKFGTTESSANGTPSGGDTVWYSDGGPFVAMGTVDNSLTGQNGANLRIDLNTSNAKPNSVGDFLGYIKYSASTEGDRSFSVTVNDGDGGTSTAASFTMQVIDNIAPTVVSIDRQTPSNEITNADSLVWRVTFSEAVANIDSADFAVSGTTGTVTNVTSAGGNAYDVTVSGGNLVSYNGNVTLSFAGGQNITDSANTPNALTTTTPTGTNNANYTLDNTVSAPTIDLSSGSDSGSSNSDNITSDTTPTVTGTAEAGATVALYDTDGTTSLGLATADGSGNWSITSSALSTGSHTLTTKATDAAGNVSVASSGLTITVDDTAPTLSSSNPADEAVSVAPSGDITLTFSEDIAKGYDEITLINITTGATVDTFDVLNGGNLTYSGNTVTLNPTSDLDEATTYAIRIDGNAVRDTAGNTYAGISDNTTLNFTTGVTDSAAPTFLSIQRADNNTITGSTTSFTLAFNEAVNVEAGDFELNTGGSVAGTIGTITGSGTNTITVNVTGISGIGTLGLNLKSGHAVTDLAGNALATAEPSDDEVYTVDTVAPTLISINCVDSETTNADSVQFMAVFSENVTGLSADDFELTGTVTSGASISTVTGTGNGYVITVSGVSGDGALGVKLKSAATMTDSAGNALTATTASAVTERYTIDNTAPIATAIITTNTALSTADTVTFDVTFDEAVANVSADDFEISGDVTGTITGITGSGSSYTVTVDSISGDGALGLNFKSGQNITDAAGNALAGTEPTTDESYTIDNTLPTVTSISRGMVNQVEANTATDVVFTVVMSETVTGIETSDFAVTGNATNTGVSSVSSSDGKVFKVTVAGVNGTIGQTLGLSFTGSADDVLSQASTAQFTSGDSYTIAGTLLNEGAMTQAQLDALVDLNREGTLLEQSVDGAKEVVIVDSRVPGLVDLTKESNPNADVWLLDGSRSATEQITEILSNYSDLDALHILSHGGVGEIYLGAETISGSSITENSDVYAAWGNALSDSGDILLYGCNVAQGDTGIGFINQLAQVTGADIAASDDLTGSAVLGGDWVLERSSGEITNDTLSIAGAELVLANQTMTFSSGASHAGFTFSGLSGGTGEIWLPNMNTTPGRITVDSGTFSLVSFQTAQWQGAENYIVSSNLGQSQNYSGSGTVTLNWSGISWIEFRSASNGGDADSIKNLVFNVPAADTTAPTFDSTPAASNIADTTLDLATDINEAGKVYYVVVADGAQAPTAAQVKAGVSYGDNNGRGATVVTSGNATVSSGDFSNTFNVTGLTASTSYDIYVVAEDDEGTPNLQSSVTKVDATTIAPANQAPIISDAVANQTVDDNATVSPFNAITLADVDGDNVSVTVALDTAAKGVFTAASLTSSGFTNAGSGSYTLSSTSLASAQAALRALVFDATDNRVAVNSTETTTFTITVNDGTVNNSNNTTTVVSTSVNDTPTDIALSDAAYSHSEGSTNVVVGSFSSTDADTGESFSYSLVAGSSDTDNAKFNINGADLRVTDRASVPAGTYSIRVQVSDGDATYEKAFSITVSDDQAPSISTIVPNDNATGVSVADSIQIAFDENVQLGSAGTITLYDITGSGANSITIDVSSHNGQLSIEDNVITINPTDNLKATNQYAVQLTAGALEDSVNNASLAVNDTTSYNFTTGTVDTTAPTVAIVDVEGPTQPNAGTVSINFSEQVTGVDITDFVLTKDGNSVDLTGLSVVGSGSVYSIDLSSVTTAGGTYVLTLATSNITDSSGNALATGDSDTFVIDTTAPTGVAIVRAGAETTNGNAATFTAVFSEAVSGVDATDFTLTGTATGGTISSVTQVSDSVYTVSVTGLSGDGTVGVDLNSTDTGITDTASNAISGGKVGQQITRDTAGPSVLSVNRDGAEVTTADTTTFTVNFSEAVSGVDVSDFSLFGGASGTVASISGSGATYQVTVNNISGDGSLRLDLNSSGTGIADLTANAIASGFTGGDSVTIDNTAPTITASQSVNLDEGMVTGTVIGQVKASDSNGVSQFAIQSGNDAGYFAIDNNGVLTLTSAGAAAIDYETATSYTLNIVATDIVGQASSAVGVTIAVQDINDNAPVISSSSTASVAENTAISAVVYDANATDADSSTTFNTLTYSLKATADHSAFTIDASTGEVTLKAAADYETKSAYDFTVIASDGMRSTEKDVTLSITDINDNTPVMTSGATGSVDENADTSTVIYTATGTDADGTATNNTLVYSLTGTDAALLDINASTGVVTLKASADYETKASYRFNVVATDNGAGNYNSGSLSSTQAVTVSVNDLNDNTPVMTSAATGSVDENADTSTVIYTATGTDADGTATNNTLVYSLTGTDAALLDINASTGVVTLKASADYETKASYRFNVVATDNGAGNFNSGSLSTTQAVTVSVNDLNDNTPAITSGATGNVDENADTSTVIYTATGTDADGTAANNTLRYSLTGDDAALLDINASTGVVTLKASADYETKASYRFNVVATDNGAGNYNSGSLSSTQAVTVSVNDLNDNTPVMTSGATGSVDENADTSTVIYTATGTDADGTATNNTLVYSLTGTDAALLDINASTGVVTLKASADYETKTSYRFNVVATDNGAGNVNSGSLSTTQAVIVSVNDLNDNTPVITSGATGSVDENADTSTVVYTATGTDADGTATNNTLVYSLTGTDAALLDINASTGVVTLKASADYETKTSYRFNVVATDNGAGNYNSGSLSTTQAVTVSVNDLNDNTPMMTSGATGSVDENADISTVIYTATGTDADGTAVNNTLRYSLTGDDAALLDINATTGVVTLKASADYETKASYRFNVVATDNGAGNFNSGSLSTTQAVIVSVNDLNDNTPVITSSATGNVDENADTSTVIYTATGTDADGTATNNTLRYSLTGDDAALLDIDSISGVVTLKVSADYETKDSYSFNVVATDNGAGNFNSGSLSTTQAVIVSVNDLNDNTPVITSSATGSVDENADTSTVIYTATGTDADGTATNNTLVYSLTGTDAALLDINATTGVVTLKASADYETKASYRFNVVATDNGAGNFNSGSLSATQAVIVSVNDLNDSAPTVVAGAATETLVEAGGVNNAAAGANSSSITLTKGDVDTVGSVSYDATYLINNGWTNSEDGKTYSRIGTYGTATLTVSTDVVSYVLNNNDSDTQSLVVGQSVTDSFMIQVTDGNATQSTSAVFNITGANDAPMVEATAAAMSGTAGLVFTPVTLPADLFADVDDGQTGQLVWSVENLPTGLVFDAVTHTISGTPQGGFEGINTLQIVATDPDGGQVKTSVTLTLRPSPVSPPVEASPEATEQVQPLGEQADTTESDIDLNVESLPSGLIDSGAGVSGFAGESADEVQLVDVAAPVDSAVSAAPSPVAESNGQGTPNGTIVSESRVSVDVGANGQVRVTEGVGQLSNSTGLTVASMVSRADSVSISLADTGTSASYSATLADGSSLPTWVKVNPTTGEVSMTPPSGQGKITLKINATDADGNIRVLEVEVDLNQLPSSVEEEPVEPAAQANGAIFVPLDEQLAVAGEQFDDYGNDLMKLLVS